MAPKVHTHNWLVMPIYLGTLAPSGAKKPEIYWWWRGGHGRPRTTPHDSDGKPEIFCPTTILTSFSRSQADIVETRRWQLYPPTSAVSWISFSRRMVVSRSAPGSKRAYRPKTKGWCGPLLPSLP